MFITKVDMENALIDVRLTKPDAVLLGQVLQYALQCVQIPDPGAVRRILKLSQDLQQEGNNYPYGLSGDHHIPPQLQQQPQQQSENI